MKTFIKMFCLALVVAIWFPTSNAVAEPYSAPYKPSVRQIIVKAAMHWATPAQPIIDTAVCESNLNSSATHISSKEHSVGIAQINLKAHTNITEEQARDNEFAANFMAENFSKNKQSMWTCYTQLYKKK